MKVCKTCVQNKDNTEFTRSKKSKDGLQHYCKTCQHQVYLEWKSKNPDQGARNAKKWREKNKARSLESNRNHHLKIRYGITAEQYHLLLISQQNLCKICEKPETMIDKRTNTARRLAVDHCGVTGAVRGLLCKKCNTGIGSLDHSPKLLRKAINYLNK